MWDEIGGVADRKNRPRWAPEKALVGGLRLAWMEATGKPASSTAKRYMKTSGYNSDLRMGTFATIVERVLKLLSVNGINVVNLLNQMALDRKKEKDTEKQRPAELTDRPDGPPQEGATQHP